MKSSMSGLLLCSFVAACAPQVAAPFDSIRPDAVGAGTGGVGGTGGGAAGSGGRVGEGTGGGAVPAGTGGGSGGAPMPESDAGAARDAAGIDQAPADAASVEVAPSDAAAPDRSPPDLPGDAGQQGPDGSAGWWDTAWTKRYKVTIVDPQLAEDLVDFQVPVKLDATVFDYQSARPGGADLRVVNQAGSIVVHQIDTWDSSGTSLIWVRLSRMTPAPVVLWLYSGNAAAAPPADATTRAVWPAPYAGVWHLSGDTKDSTVNEFDGMTMSGGTFPAARFGKGLKLNGARREHVVLKNNIKILGGAPGCTFSAWINPTNLEDSVNGVVIMTLGKWFTNNHNSYADFNVNAAGQMLSHIDSGPNTGASGYQRINSIPGLIKPAEWAWVTYVIDLAAAEERFFKNGQLVDTKKPPSGSFPTRTFIDMVSSRVVIGTEEDNVAHWYTGDMDELRIERTMRTPAWIAAQFRAMTVTNYARVEAAP